MKPIVNLILLTVITFGVSFTGVAQQWSDFSPELLKASVNGDGNAQNYLGIAYSEGLGVRPNQKKAVFWFTKSAGNGDVYGTCNLGLHYARGHGVRRNKIEALKWSFVANSLDGLKCQPGDFVEMLKMSKCETETAWGLALTWLRTHPDFVNHNFGGGSRPWMGEGEYGITRREGGGVIDLPVKSSDKCKPKKKARATKK